MSALRSYIQGAQTAAEQVQRQNAMAQMLQSRDQGNPMTEMSAPSGDLGGFAEALGYSESGGNYSIVNEWGYGGKYQFGEARLDDYRRATGREFTMDEFVGDPRLQEEVFRWHMGDIDRRIDAGGYDRFIGQTVGGVPITRDGLRAKAHLGGFGGMARFLDTGGQYNPSDALGTSLSDYGTRFANPMGRMAL